MQRRAFLLVLAFALMTAACSTTGPTAHPVASKHTPTTALTTAPGIALTATPAMPEVDLQALVTRLTLGPADLKPGFTTELTPNGDKVTGQVTFNNCGYRFTSETHRVARRQVVIVDNKNQPAGVSNEIIAYDTPQAAASALAQYRESVTTCNLKTVHTFAATNTPSFRYDISNTEISPNLPVTDNAIIILGVQTTNPPIRHDYQVIIIQHQGTVLDILYFPTTARPTLKSLNEATPLGVLVGHKLTKAIPNH